MGQELQHVSRRVTVEKFRDRLAQVIDRSGLSRSAFAAQAQIDRSTLSQILSRKTDRLPRVETLAAIAAIAQVSLDWLCGLTEHGALATNVLPEIELAKGSGLPSDDRLEAWYRDAIGTKIRHVPTTLPDSLKTVDVVMHEYSRAAGTSPQARIETTQLRLAYQRRLESDTEVCTSVQTVRTFALGRGIWRDLDAAIRRKQLEQLIELVEELYPTFRWFLFDERERYSVPLTVFGTARAAIYVGQGYFVFNGIEHIRNLSKHFDELVRSAVVQTTEVPQFLRELYDTIE